MNLHIIRVIIGREYLNKVRKKSFLVITFLVPVLFAAITLLPALIMRFAKEERKTVSVVDRSGVVMPYLQDNELAAYSDASVTGADSLKFSVVSSDSDVLLIITPLETSSLPGDGASFDALPGAALFDVKAETYSPKPIGADLQASMEAQIRQAVRQQRIASYDIDHLDAIIGSVQSDVAIKAYTIDADGKQRVSESTVYMLVSMLLGMLVYLFITLFSGGVMSSVIEEKSSRVVEVLVSSVRATELMFGKIIGVALVALTQFFLWMVLTAVLLTASVGILGKDALSPGDLTAPAGMELLSTGSQPSMPVSGVLPSEVTDLIATLSSMPWGEIILCFLLFFLFGYLLYASLFAAIGSAVENEADTQQLQIPVTIPLLLGFFIAIAAYKVPDSPLVLWGSMIPFTSPIVMLARLPFGVPLWEILLSIGLLVLTFLLCAWMSARIYKVGILMFGRKSSFRDLWKWLRMR